MRVLNVRFKSSTPLEDPWLEVALQIAAVPGLLSKTGIQDGELSRADVHAGIDRNRCMESSYQDTVAQVDGRFNTSIEKIAAQSGEQRDLVSKR